MFLVDELDDVDGGGGPVEDQLRLLHDLPDANSSVATAGAHAALANSGVDTADAILMTEPEITFFVKKLHSCGIVLLLLA
jgi:hypothetical protein